MTDVGMTVPVTAPGMSVPVTATGMTVPMTATGMTVPVTATGITVAMTVIGITVPMTATRDKIIVENSKRNSVSSFLYRFLSYCFIAIGETFLIVFLS